MKRSRKPRSAPHPGDTQTALPATVYLDAPARKFPRATVLHLLALAAVTCALYFPSLRNGFVTDDTLQMLQNPFITSYRYIPRLFATNVWAFAQSDVSNYYRPLQMLVYMAEYHAFGFRPWPFHMFNVLAGLAAAIAVYFLVRALAESASLALWTALLFAFHPVHVEAMVWIAALPDLLCGLSLFTSMLFYHRARGGVRPLLNYAMSTAIYFAGLFCKETAMVFPALLLAYEFLYRRESLRSLFSLSELRRIAPYLGALGVYLVFRLRALGSFAPASGGTHRLTAWQHFLSVPVLFSQYVLKLVCPVNLNYYYYFVPQGTLGWKFLASAVMIGALAAALFRLRKSHPLLSFAVAWFFITLAPALSIETVSDSVFADRYLFIPSLGFCLAVAFAWVYLTRQPLRKPVLGVAYSCFGLLLAFYIVQIERRIPDWHDDVRLFEKTVQQSPGSPAVQLNLGETYYQAGKFDLAIAPIERSLALGRADFEPHMYLALSLAPLGRYEDANAELRLAYQLEPPGRRAWSAFGVAHASLHQWDQAADCYRHAAEEAPKNQLMFELLGEALQQKGDMPGAMSAWRRAIDLQPAYLDASLNLAVASAQAGNTGEAVALLTAALEAHPKEQHSDDAYANLGAVYMHRGEWDAAEAAYQHALDLNPDLTFARQNVDAIEARRRAQP